MIKQKGRLMSALSYLCIENTFYVISDLEV